MKPPATVGQLYDVLQNWFGLGTWDEVQERPYYLARVVEVKKLERLLSARATTVPQLYAAARYCRERNIAVRTSLGLFAYLRDGLAADLTARELAAMRATQVQIEAAVAWETQTYPGEDRWLGQLLRVQGEANKKEALRRWKRARRL